MTFAPENFREYIGAAMTLGLDAPALAVVVALRFHADDEGRVYRTVAEISADAGVNRKTAMDRLVHLAALQIVERVVESRRGNVYQLSRILKSATRTSEVRHADHRSPPEGLQKSARGTSGDDQKSATGTSEVRLTDFRSPPDGPLNHRGSYSGSDANKNKVDEDARTPEQRAHIATSANTADEVAQKLQGHPGREALLPIARVAVSILGACPEVYTLESWFQQRYSLPRIEYGLKQAKQAAFGQFVPMGKIIISAGRWMRNAQPAEYQQGPQAPVKGQEAAQPTPMPPSEVRKPLTAEETAAMLAELGV